MTIYDHGTSVKHNLKISHPQGGGVGARLKKIDSLDKLFGRSPYTDDIALPNMLFGKIVRSPHAHAKILKIHKESVSKLSGVVDVIVGSDFNKKYGVIPWTKDEYPLAPDKARYVGDGLAAIIAHSEEQAYEAALKLDIEYEILESILNIKDARELSHIKVNEHAREANITKAVDLSFGEVEKEFKEAYLTLEEDFYFHNTSHAPLEPHCAIADYSPRGELTLYSSTQVPHYVHRTLADVLEIDPAHIRVIRPQVGGAFGGKSEPFDLEFVVALASMRLARPVKILYSREEVFFAHRGRHPMNMRMAMAVDKAGKITGLKNIIDIDGGAYASFGMITAFYAGQLLTGPLNMKSYSFKSTRYYTNKPACGPKRGHGSVQPRFAFEIMCDMMAEKLQLNPLEFRMRNLLAENSQTINGQKIGSLGIKDCLEKVAQRSRFLELHQRLPYGQGVGIACSMYISGTNYPVYPNDMPQSSVSVRLDRFGHVSILSQAADIGQGSNQILAQLVSEELGLDAKKITVISGDSALCPTDLGSYSSRVTLMMGLAAQEALRKCRERLALAFCDFVNSQDNFTRQVKEPAQPENISFARNKIYVSDNPELSCELAFVATLAESQHGALIFTGDYRTKERGAAYRGGSIGASPAYSCTAHVAFVTVDACSGRLKINRVFVAHDCGKAINPLLVEGQIEGSTYMGAAEVSLEHFLTDEEEGARRGMLMATSLLDYRIPSTLDTPDIEAMIVEHPDHNGPYGAKEAGEGPLHSVIPAVANAIYDAVGVRLFSLPFSPKKIREAIEKAKKIEK
jgi:4-hydroxybenzoyl-CoA reductase subunit alpha